MAKNSFVIYHEYYETLADLTDEQIGKLFRALFDYEMNKKEPSFDGELKLAFRFIKKDLDINSAKYENICKRNKENIEKRWYTKNTSGKSGIPKIPDDTKNTDNDNEYNNILLRKKESNNKNISTHTHESYDDIFESFGVSASLKETFISFIRHCKANGHIIINDKLKDIITRLYMVYGGDDVPKHKSLQKAINGGYFDIQELRD